MIKFESISKEFNGTKVLEDVSFNIEEGELLVLLGASGSGKTTLLKMINGLESPSDGEIYIDKKRLTEYDLTDLRKNMGYVIQQVGLFPHYSIYDNIALVPRLKNTDEKTVDKSVRHWMERLGLSFDEQARKFPRALSGGQAQRVGLARALVAEPKMILMDEPFSALDPISRTQIRNDFKAIQQKEKITVIMVTHDLQEAVSLADRICLIADHHIQQISSPPELIFRPENEYVEKFIGSDKFQAELIACRIAFLVPFLEEKEIAADGDKTLLQVLQSANNEETKRLMQAFYKWREQWA